MIYLVIKLTFFYPTNQTFIALTVFFEIFTIIATYSHKDIVHAEFGAAVTLWQ